MRLSIIIPILDSHEIVRRQILHFARMSVPDTEWIFVDDGSDPPLEGEMEGLTVLRTNDFRPWTWPLARNEGARVARGEYLLMTDIDHILTQAAIKEALAFCGDKMMFARKFGILDERGILVQCPKVLAEWGLKAKSCKPHPNTFAMKQSVFWRLGGYTAEEPQEDDKGISDRLFNKRFRAAVQRQDCAVREVCQEPIYAFPTRRFCGDDTFNPFGMFHTLSLADRPF